MSDIEFDVNQYADQICKRLDDMIEFVKRREWYRGAQLADGSATTSEEISAKDATRMMIQSDVDRYLSAGGEIKHIPTGFCVSPEYSTWGMGVEDFK